MTPITATIQSIVQLGTGLVVYVIFSNSTTTVQYNFGQSDTASSITDRIQGDVDAMNNIQTNLPGLQSLVNTVIQSS